MNEIHKFYRFLIGFTLLIGLFVLPLYAFKVSQKKDYTDFSVYYRAAVRAKNAQWAEIYNLGDGASPFRYAPPFIPLFRPFAELDKTSAQVTWYFLQYFSFLLAFYSLYKTLNLFGKKSKRNASFRVKNVAIVCASFLFVLRFCLDTFMIGQSSSLLFLFYCWGLLAWVSRRSAQTTTYLFIPALFKIGPGFLYGVFLSTHARDVKKSIQLLASLLIGMVLLTTIWARTVSGRFSLAQDLWKNWIQMVINDSVYYDASHYGSQSLKSFLLRSANWGWISPSGAHQVGFLLIGLIVGSGVIFWLTRTPRSPYGRALFYSLGLFAVMWLMPETFKYSLTPLAIPIALILASPVKSALGWFSLGLGTLSLSLAGKDLVGDTLFFGNQVYSIPLLATLFLGGAMVELAWKNSKVSPLSQKWIRFFNLQKQKAKPLGPWQTQPTHPRRLQISWIIPIWVSHSARIHPTLLKKFIEDTLKVLKIQSQGSFEIILVVAGGHLDPESSLSQALQTIHFPFRWVIHSGYPGRGAALRAGFLESWGQKILISDPEQLCEPSFFSDALRKLDEGYDLVRANRRLLESRFEIQVRLLPLIYKRHRLGLLFNQVVKFFLPIQTTDTHAGILAISWKLATHAFAVQTTPDFLFDLELCLAAKQSQSRELDLPVSLILFNEKPFTQVLWESGSILLGLPVLTYRYRQGYYVNLPPPRLTLPDGCGITADDWGLSRGVNQGILKLAKQGIVRRISILANGPVLEDGLKELMAIPQLQLGLHFNLTYGKPCSENLVRHTTLPSTLIEPTDRPNGYRKGGLIASPARFLFHWLNPFENRKAHRQFVRLELESQLKKLDQLGVPIQYLDGHHHIHLVPGIIAAVADLIQKAGIRQIRLPQDQSLWKTSQAPLLLLSFFARFQFKKHGFCSAPCLYPHRNYFRDHGKLRAQLTSHPLTEVIVHPAETNDLALLEFPESYTEARVLEFKTLQMLNQPWIEQNESNL